MGPIEQKPQFKKIQNFKADYTEATFTQYESQRTGMRVVVVDRKGPKVYGYFAVATEIHDDTGAPHTLEHLVFMGSRKYPYKGVLDKIATRAYSDTNAWTDTQETVYSLHTAGWEGFAQLLPIYLDHVVVPTITDSGCLTEVHHIDGTGNDAGVVYSEMQGRENLQGDLMDLQMRRLLYPEGNGFRYETGGMMKALRVLTADRIRDFHKEMYQPKNVRVVLIGEVDHDNLLDILDKFEDDIVDVVPSYDAPFKRPWVESKPTPPLSKTVIDTVEFPEEDESTGEIQIAFIGPEANDDKAETVLNTVLMYLAGSSVSVLVNTLVEKEHLGSMVYYWVRAYYDLVIWFTITSVETKKLAEVEKRFFEVLQDHLSKPLDMAYMKDCLRRFKRQVKFTSETSNDEWKDSVIRDHLYGNRDGSHLEEGLSSLRVFEELEDWKEEDWKAFIKKWISDAHHVSLLGKPSLALSDKIKADEAARVKAQQEKFGEDGLKKLAQQLEDAKAENDKPIPEKYLVDLPVPGTDSIHFFDTVTARSGLAKKLGVPENEIQKIIDNDAKNLPLFIHYEHIPTSFVTFGLALGTAAVPLHLKPLLGVYLTNFFTTAVTIDGKRIEFEEVTTRLEQDTIEYSLDRGTDIGNSEMIYIYFVVEQDKFETAVKWLKTMLKDSIFDQERLQSAVQKMLADVPDEKRDGNSMAFAVDRIIHYDKPSAVRATNTLVKAVYLKKLKKLLKEDPKRVIGYFEELRDALVTFSNMRVLAIANFSSLPNPVSTFSHLTEAVTTPSNPDVNPIDDRKTVLSDLGRKPGGAAYIVPMPIDSSFGVLTSAGPNSYTSPQLPPLFVALAYLDAVEGPMWQNIRGTGLAYGANFFKDVETGLLKWRIYKSPNAFSAFKTAKEVVNTYITGERKLEKLALEGAISSIVREFVDEKATIMDAARGSFTDLVVRGVGKDWSDWVLREVRKVKEDDIIQILKDVVINIFDPEKADLVVACGNGQIKEELKKNFEEAGFKHVEVKELHKFQEESQDGYGLEDVKVDDDADEDDEDDDAEGSEEGSDDEMED
ncbi:metallopeptidase [Lophiotrema nucula]|uniref:Metallopeptidase n=1 Tax=Lophiotrema nucula TaxID=690887 RepID=A0A6A5YZT2_9PLEO|nr:metallopeptidase [Lophiotrema nucula]